MAAYYKATLRNEGGQSIVVLDEASVRALIGEATLNPGESLGNGNIQFEIKGHTIADFSLNDADGATFKLPEVIANDGDTLDVAFVHDSSDNVYRFKLGLKADLVNKINDAESNISTLQNNVSSLQSEVTSLSQTHNTDIASLTSKIQSLNKLGQYHGTVDTKDELPKEVDDTSAAGSITKNDFIYVIADETRGGKRTRYVCTNVATTSPHTITWEFESVVDIDMSGMDTKIDKVPTASINNIPRFTEDGSLADSGKPILSMVIEEVVLAP